MRRQLCRRRISPSGSSSEQAPCQGDQRKADRTPTFVLGSAHQRSGRRSHRLSSRNEWVCRGRPRPRLHSDNGVGRCVRRRRQSRSPAPSSRRETQQELGASGGTSVAAASFLRYRVRLRLPSPLPGWYAGESPATASRPSLIPRARFSLPRWADERSHRPDAARAAFGVKAVDPRYESTSARGTHRRRGTPALSNTAHTELLSVRGGLCW
jgi:hypothetical protein